MREGPDRVGLARCIPFLIPYAGTRGDRVGWSWFAVTVTVALYFLRIFAVTGIYHR
jgi:stearoyl-CoA desaturase (delta-9 desaturase)